MSMDISPSVSHASDISTTSSFADFSDSLSPCAPELEHVPPPQFDSDCACKQFLTAFSYFFARSIVFTSTQIHDILGKAGSDARYSFTKDGPLRAIGTGCFIDDISSNTFNDDTSSFSRWIPLSQQDASLVEYLSSTSFFVLSTIVQRLKVTMTEILQGIILLERAIICSDELFPFRLLQTNASMALVVAIMVAHKTNCDKPFQNAIWGKLFNVPPEHVSHSELFFLKSLNFRVLVEEKDYHTMITLCGKIIKANSKGLGPSSPPSQLPPLHTTHLSPTPPSYAVSSSSTSIPTLTPSSTHTLPTDLPHSSNRYLLPSRPQPIRHIRQSPFFKRHPIMRTSVATSSH